MSQANCWRTKLGMKPAQLGVVLLCMLINMLDGYDIFIMGFALPHLPEGFASSAEKGYLLSSTLVGMGIGAVFLARMADVVGRRITLRMGLGLNTVALAFSAGATSYETLIVCRFATGLAVGMLAVVIIVLAPEIAPPARRNLAVGIVMLGAPLGTTLAGASGATFISLTGGSWNGMFWIGAALSVTTFVATWFFLPESVVFLRRKGTEKAHAAADALVEKFGPEQVESDVSPELRSISDRSGKVYLLGRELRSRTICLWLCYGLLCAAYYFVGTWTPQLVADASGDIGSGALAGVMMSVGTILGAVAFGVIGLRRPAVKVVWMFVVVGIAAVVAFSMSLQGALALCAACLLGLCLFAAMTALTGAATAIYPVEIRAKGYGAMSGMGRVGAITAPVVAGYALLTVSANAMYAALTVPLGIAAMTAVVLSRSDAVSVVGGGDGVDGTVASAVRPQDSGIG